MGSHQSPVLMVPQLGSSALKCIQVMDEVQLFHTPKGWKAKELREFEAMVQSALAKSA